VAGAHQQFSNEPAARAVLRGDRAGRVAAHGSDLRHPVEQHHGNAGVDAVIGERRRQRRRGHHDAIDLVLQDVRQDVVSFFRLADKQQYVIAILL